MAAFFRYNYFVCFSGLAGASSTRIAYDGR